MSEPYDGRNFKVSPSLNPAHVATQHADRAEELLRTVHSGIYGFTPVAVSVAQVHATLAGVYAQLAIYRDNGGPL